MMKWLINQLARMNQCMWSCYYIWVSCNTFNKLSSLLTESQHSKQPHPPVKVSCGTINDEYFDHDHPSEACKSHNHDWHEASDQSFVSGSVSSSEGILGIHYHRHCLKVCFQKLYAFDFSLNDWNYGYSSCRTSWPVYILCIYATTHHHHPLILFPTPWKHLTWNICQTMPSLSWTHLAIGIMKTMHIVKTMNNKPHSLFCWTQHPAQVMTTAMSMQ